jgi:1-acyl-sn-glycerol-3-phosphate acyltransferase
MHAVLPQTRRSLILGTELIYGVYAAFVLVTLATFTWIVTAVTPMRNWAWAIGGASARAFFRLVGVKLIVRGAEKLPPGVSNVLVANHSSYLDGVALVAALATPYRFVAKRELQHQLVAGIYLSRLGSEFVERFDAQQSVQDANRLAHLAASGTPLAFFPEGTFTRAPGLMPFHLGAFVAAARARVPVIPVGIRGTRSVLRAGQWFPRRGTIVVTVGRPILPPTNMPDDFTAAIVLRDAARSVILPGCGEADMTQTFGAQDAVHCAQDELNAHTR